MKQLRHCFLLGLFLLAAGLGSARAQSFAWAKVARGLIDTTFAKPQASATDLNGSTYVAMTFSDSLRIGSLLLTGPHRESSAVVRFDSTGAVVWGKVLYQLQVSQLAADNSAGGVFVTAYNYDYGAGTATWGGAPVPGSINGNCFFGKCSAAGMLTWTQLLPQLIFSAPSIVADNAGNAYVGGIANIPATVGGINVDSGQVFVLKTNGAGTSQWARILHGVTGRSIYTTRLWVKPGGGCLVSGIVRGTLYRGAGFTNPVVTGQSNGESFLSNFDAAGNHLWSNRGASFSSGTQATAAIGAAAADASGSCYVTGSTNGSLPAGGALVAGFFLAKYDPSGALLWVRGTLPGAASANSAGTLLAVNSSGPTVAVRTGAIYGQAAPAVGSFSLRSPFNFVHYTAQGLEQWAVADAWPGYIFPLLPYFEPSGLGCDARGNLYPVGFPKLVGQSPMPAIQLGALTAVGKGTIVSRINAYANTLRGLVYYDLNGNGQQDSGEGAFPRQLSSVLTQGSSTLFSPVGTDGVVQAYAGPGAYALTVAALPSRYTFTQPSSGTYTGTFTGTNQVVSGQVFGIVPIPNQPDIRVTIAAYGAVRAGFITRYRVTLENVGTTTVPLGTVTLALDSHMTYISSTPSGTVTGQTISWMYAPLAPFGQQNYDVLFSLPTNVTMGTALVSTATAPLAGDVVPADNTAPLAQTVVASFDPNAIDVNYERLTPTQVAAQQPLDYTIHFQNLGTAFAQNVVLSDTLDFNKLNLSTLLLVSQSHNCVWSLSSTGPNKGLLTVRFLGINLPERNVDVIRSQGFVRFRVQPRPTLAVGEIIPNHAGIVFDYNAPVITNTATTTVFLASAVLSRHDAPAWTAYPNPATDLITLSAELVTAGAVRVELLDVLGRPVRQQTITAPTGPLRQTIDLSGLTKGVYVLRLTLPSGPASSQRVVRE